MLFFLDGFLFYRHCLKESDRRHFIIIEGFEKLKMASNMSANTGFSTIIIISYNDFKYVCAYFVIKSWRMIKGETSLVLIRLITSNFSRWYPKWPPEIDYSFKSLVTMTKK